MAESKISTQPNLGEKKFSKELLIGRTHALIAPGQGGQRPGMGLDLARVSPAAAHVWEQADEALGFPFSQIVWGGSQEELTRTQNAQPAIIVDSLARAAAMEEAGERGRPGYFAGNSLGFVTSTVNAGALNHRSAAQVGRARGEAFQYAIENGPKTTMAALSNIDGATIQEVCARFDLVVCLINAAEQIVVGGEVAHVQKAIQYLQEMGMGDRAAQLEVDAAFHSRYMESAVPMFERALKNIAISAPIRGILIGGSGEAKILVSPDDIRQELVSQLITAENWASVADRLHQEGVIITTDTSNTRTLSAMMRRAFKGQMQPVTLQSPNGEVTMGYRWIAPEGKLIAGGSDKVPTFTREEVIDWYIKWVADRAGLDESDITPESHFVDDAALDSQDLAALRAAVKNRFGRNVTPEEAKKLLTVGAASDATFNLVNGG